MIKKVFLMFLFFVFSIQISEGTVIYPTADTQLIINPYASTTTLVIAKSTSYRSVGADYICDGTDDDVQINAALTALATTANGGKIFLLEGTYIISGPITIPSMTNGTISIEGLGALNTTIYATNGSNCDMIRTNITSGDQTFIVIKNIMIQGNRSNNPSGGRGYYDGIGTGQGMDTLFQNVFFYNMHGNCMEFKTCWGTRIVDCIFEDSDAKGIYFAGGSEASSEGNKLIHILGSGIETNAAGTLILKSRIFMAGTNNIGINLLSGANYSLVCENEIHHDTEVSGCTGIKSATGKAIISNNQVENNGDSKISPAIYLTNTSSYSFGTGNIVDNSGTKIINNGVGNTITVNGVNY